MQQNDIAIPCLLHDQWHGKCPAAIAASHACTFGSCAPPPAAALAAAALPGLPRGAGSVLQSSFFYHRVAVWK